MKTTVNTTPNIATLSEWLDLDLEGQLDGAEKAHLETQLEASSGLRAERRALAALHAMFDEGRIPARPDLRARVMSSLPVASWEAHRFAAWALPLAMMLLLTLGAVLTLGTAGHLVTESPIVGTVVAVVDFLGATTMAGGGLLAASWHGLGLGLEEFIAESGLNLLSLATLVVFLNLLFFGMLRRPKVVRAAESAEREKAGDDG
ncbi:MAG: hypothetical protein GY856_26360 [bacterium]|nr:hypothetical protein [bacterium]